MCITVVRRPFSGVSALTPESKTKRRDNEDRAVHRRRRSHLRILEHSRGTPRTLRIRFQLVPRPHLKRNEMKHLPRTSLMAARVWRSKDASVREETTTRTEGGFILDAGVLAGFAGKARRGEFNFPLALHADIGAFREAEDVLGVDSTRCAASQDLRLRKVWKHQRHQHEGRAARGNSQEPRHGGPVATEGDDRRSEL
jgi:hypothetical protein